MVQLVHARELAVQDDAVHLNGALGLLLPFTASKVRTQQLLESLIDVVAYGVDKVWVIGRHGDVLGGVVDQPAEGDGDQDVGIRLVQRGLAVVLAE